MAPDMLNNILPNIAAWGCCDYTVLICPFVGRLLRRTVQQLSCVGDVIAMSCDIPVFSRKIL